VSSTADLPGARRRPRDRRQQIVAASARLFAEQGYRQVGMAEVAAQVRIGASALYRHFRGKSDLLVAVLDDALDSLEAATGGAPPPGELLAAIAEVTLTRRDYVALWDREASELPPDAAERLRARRDRLLGRVREVGERLVEAGPEASGEQPGGDGVGPPGPDAAAARAVAALAVLQSPARHHVELEREVAVALLRAAATACLTAPLPRLPGAPARPATPLVPRSRGEALLATASRLFAERGYHAVSLTEIGAATGIAGPSIYNHFASKLDLLTAILNRGNETLWFALHRALAEAADAPDALGRLVGSYVDVVGSSGVVPVLLTEVASLPEAPRERYRAVQQRYVSEWVGLLRCARPELDEPAARVLVHAALAAVNALTSAGPVVSAARVRVLARAALGLPDTAVDR
jgi:AcrR family transcriptional regulator